jgi:hypothetical protein
LRGEYKKKEMDTPTNEFTEHQLRTLAMDKTNLVYHWKDRDVLPAHHVVSVGAVADKVRRLYSLLTTLRQETIAQQRAMGPKRWQYIKRHILSIDEWRQFDYTHPLIFDRVVSLETTDLEIDGLAYMMQLKESEMAGEITNGKELLTKHLLRTFGMTPAAWDAKNRRDGITSCTPITTFEPDITPFLHPPDETPR